MMRRRSPGRSRVTAFLLIAAMGSALACADRPVPPQPADQADAGPVEADGPADRDAPADAPPDTPPPAERPPEPDSSVLPDRAPGVDAEGSPAASGWFWEARPAQVAINAMWGSSPTDLWAVGQGGLALHDDGGAWLPVDTGVEAPLLDIWGSTADDIYITTGTEDLVHHDGRHWSLVDTGGPGSLTQLAGSSSSHVVAGGARLLRRFDGQRWNELPRVPVWVRTLFTPDPSSIYVAGQAMYNTGWPWPADLVVHFNGQTFTNTNVPSIIDAAGSFPIPSIWSPGGSIMYVIGYEQGFRGPGTTHLNRSDTVGVWTETATWPGHSARIVGSGEDDLYFLGAKVHHWDGKTVTELPVGDSVTLTAGWSIGRGDLVAAASNGAIYRLSDGSWSRVRDAPPQPHVQIVGHVHDNAAGDAYAIAGSSRDGAVVLKRRERIGWSRWETPAAPARRCLWVAADGDVHLVDAYGRHHRFRRGAWNQVGQLGVACFHLTGAGQELFAVGFASNLGLVALRFDGESWSALGAGMTGQTGYQDVPAIIRASHAADVLVLAGEKTYHFDGQDWHRGVVTPTGEEPRNVQAVSGSGPDDLFAVDGGVLHWDGSTWTRMPTGFEWTSFRSIWGQGQDSVFVAGDAGVILHYDGHRWQRLDTGPLGNLNLIWGSASGDLFAFESTGGILRGLLRQP
jgi:hypothetical protein